MISLFSTGYCFHRILQQFSKSLCDFVLSVKIHCSSSGHTHAVYLHKSAKVVTLKIFLICTLIGPLHQIC